MSGTGNPYIGPRSFKQDQGDRFFGRDYESAELLALVISNRLVTYYAQSGAGKSSLINARLAPDLREAGFLVLPVGRVSGVSITGPEKPAANDDNADAVPKKAVKNIYAYNLMLSLDQGRETAKTEEEDEQEQGQEAGKRKGEDEEVKPYSRLELAQFMSQLTTEDELHYYYDAGLDDGVEAADVESGLPHILLIDQFEEILTTNVERWQEREDFFRQLGEAMRADPMMWVVFIMRQDYVAALDPFAHLLPGRMRTGFYMQRMAREAALKAITRPAALAGRPFEDDAAEELADKLSLIRIHGQEQAIPGQFIEPVQLQVVCHQLWEKIESRDKDRGKRSSNITCDDLALAPVERALSDFYEAAVAETAAAFPAIPEIALRTWFEDELITKARTRGTVYQDEYTTGSLPNEAVAFLQRSYLVRGESRAGGRWIELIHDSFVEPILEANQHWKEKNPLIKAALEWQANPDDESLLFEGANLANALETPNWRSLGRAVREFLTESQDKEAGSETVRKLRRLEAKKYVAESGWGIIFADDAGPAIGEALDELLQFRRGQAGELFKIFDGKNGYRPGDSADKFLTRHGVGPGTFRPDKVPYYLLIVGDPETIPWSFEYQLSLEYGVGRIHFEEMDDYARYACSVATVGDGPGSLQLPRQALMFSVRNPDDRATQLSHTALSRPLFQELSRLNPSWRIESLFEEEASKENLSALFHGPQKPALLFTSGHGMTFPSGHEKRYQHSGAIVCQDWPGPQAWRGKGAIGPDYYFSADDIADDARLLGMVAFLWGGDTVGTPRYDNFYKVKSGKQTEIATRPFVAYLPQRLLSHPNGGALAVIGHVERTWGYSISWESAGSQIGVFSQAFDRLLDGYPVGAAMESFRHRYGRLAAMLSAELEAIESGMEADSAELVKLWTATSDARNYVIFGDPAVKVNVSQEQIEMDEWPVIDPVQFRPVSSLNIEIPLPAAPPEAVLPPAPAIEAPISKGLPEEMPLPAAEADGEAPTQLLYFNGINGDSGVYARPPMTVEELSAFIAGESPPENLAELRDKHRRRS